MLEKKSSKGDLEKKRATFVLLGLIAVLGLTYVGFELFANQTKQMAFSNDEGEWIAMVEIDAPATDNTPPQVQPQQPVASVIRIVDDIMPTIDIGDIFDVETQKDYNPGPYEPIPILSEKADLPPPTRIPAVMPEFPGGKDALYAFLRANLKYPEFSRTVGIQGIVLIEFIIERDGSASNIKVMNSVSDDCDQEAIRVVKMMPNWIPGKNAGQPVRVIYQLPIIFSLK